MGYLFKEALKTLCGVNQWSYAVFWKFACQNPKLLIWEDCYYGPASCYGLPGIPEYENQEFTFQDYNASYVSAETRNSKVHLLVNKMMMDNQINIVGEGLVGRVAFSGNHQWILSDNCYREAHPPEVLKEICQQFSAGMQTVAVIPVLPHGVVQFGSHLTITENMGFVNDVVSLVLQLGHVPGVMLSDNYAAKEHSPKTGFPQCPGYSTPGDSSLESNMISSFSSISDSYNYVGGSAQTSTFDSQTSYSLPFQASNSNPCLLKPHDLKQDFSYPNQFMNKVAKAEIIPSNKKIRGKNHPSNNATYYDAFVQSQSGDDLFDILGADFKNTLFSSSSNNMRVDNNTSDIYFTSQENSGSGIFSSIVTDHLLDAVVSKVHPSAKQSLDDSTSCKTTVTNMSSSSKPSVSLPYGRFGISDDMKGELLGIPTYLAKENSRTYSQGSSIYSSLIEEKGNNVKHNNSVSTGYSKKPHETSKTNRKRLKPGENPKPRPKDRQMIQDRVKELREIVPHGAKCSIDALLERTIKHMFFLQSVTKHADKLKQNADSKIISKDGGLLLKDNFEGGGATWAYEVGSQSMVCPIIVEDLNQPRQMLVEMLCEERGLFLEIADIIRGLGLTILKGVMETRNDKIWARFSVEANRDITRMEIFMSLVRLLEQSSKTGVSQHNSVCNENLLAQQSHQAASVPTIGRIP